MKTGIIIVFHNNGEKIDSEFIINNLAKLKSLKICLVNNHCKDNTSDILIDISERCKNVSIVNVKKLKTNTSAVRAGVRYLWNNYSIEQIGYAIANGSDLTKHELNSIIKDIVRKEEFIINYSLNILQKEQSRKTLFQSIFSLQEYFNTIDTNIKTPELL